MVRTRTKYTAGGSVLGYLLGGLDTAVLGGIGGYLLADYRSGGRGQQNAAAMDWNDAYDTLDGKNQYTV